MAVSSDDIYEARRALLGGKEPVVTAEIPESYNIPVATGAIPNFGVYNPFSVGASPCSPYGLQLELGLGSPMGAMGAALSPSSPPALPPWLLSPQHRAPLHLPPLPPLAHANTPLLYKNSPNSWNCESLRVVVIHMLQH